MNRRQFLQTVSAAPATFASAPLAAAPAKRPNIVVILADDMGYSDIGCYGGEVDTPNLNRLAKGGIRFTQFYNTARCCPTRSSLLTGLYPHQTGVGHMVDTGRKDLPGYTGDLNRSSVTIAEVLKTAGYRTYMSGKWHVTPVTESKHNWPRQRGFDRFFGTIHGAGSFYDPATLTRDNETIQPDKPDFFYTDAIADNACDFIGDTSRAQDPFFLYCAFTAPHWPLHAIEKDIAKYKGRYKDGWDSLRIERHKRMIDAGIVDRRWRLTARDPRVPAWSSAPDKEWQQRRMEVYAAQIDRMDQSIGRILDKLKQTGAEENTLILFLADNGGCAEELAGRGPLPRHIPEKTRDGRPVRRGNDPQIMPGPDDTYQSYGIGWANASNTPFRLYKHWVHEGGIATPLIAHWPAVIRKRGGFSHQPGHLIDIMATCCEVGNARYPTEFQNTRIQPLEGRSLLPILRGGKRQDHPEIYWEHEGNRAVRQGKWKLVSRHPDNWELFDLEADRTETDDLVVKQSAKAQELAAKWDAWAKRCNVVPWEEFRKT
jgi:arylsulfatase